MDAAKEKGRAVTVASIPPRIASGDTREKIDAVNAGLAAMCTEKGVKFANNDLCFLFSDGSVNEDYIETDGIHLTPSCVNRLAKTIGVKAQGYDGHHGCLQISGEKERFNGLPATPKRGTQRTRNHQLDCGQTTGNPLLLLLRTRTCER